MFIRRCRAMKKPPNHWKQVLRFSRKKAKQQTVRRFYGKYRQENNLPERCDIEGCEFHSGHLVWNEKSIRMILDHVNGNSRENSPWNLRLVCPNCNSQLNTHGGRNKNRIQNENESGYEVAERDGSRRDAIIHATMGTDARLSELRTIVSPEERST